MWRRNDTIDPDLLVCIPYQPGPLTFAGNCVDREVFLAHRSELLQIALERLNQGPHGKVHGHQGDADIDRIRRNSGRDADQGRTRPGSFGQSSVHCSPNLSGDYSIGDAYSRPFHIFEACGSSDEGHDTISTTLPEYSLLSSSLQEDTVMSSDSNFSSPTPNQTSTVSKTRPVHSDSGGSGLALPKLCHAISSR